MKWKDKLQTVHENYQARQQSKRMSDKRQNEKQFYERTQNSMSTVKSHAKKTGRAPGLQSKRPYELATQILPWVIPILAILIFQTLIWQINKTFSRRPDLSYFFNGDIWILYIVILVISIPILSFVLKKKIMAVWYNNNTMWTDEDMQTYHNDAYIRTTEHLTQELDIAPDAGMGFNDHASTLLGHVFISNNGIKEKEFPERDITVPGQVKTDQYGNIVCETKPVFDKEFGDLLYDFSGVPVNQREWINAKDYPYNPILPKKDGGDGKKRVGGYGRKAYDTLADYINNEWYTLPTDTQRPAGGYFFDNRAVNTILIGITRSGKGQTYLEAAIDTWRREKEKWNLALTDPKGELLAKHYYSYVKSGYEVIQFNLMRSHMTDVFNPLVNALQEFRRGNNTKGTALIDSIVETIFPDNNEIWNPAAGNMFRRAVYAMFNYYIERESYMRDMATRNGTSPEILEAEIDKMYSKLTMYNINSFISELSSKVSKDVTFINPNPERPRVAERDLLSLLSEAEEMLPRNALREKMLAADKAIKQIAPAPQTLAGIYANLLTGLSAYVDDTVTALMSGSPNESFDVTSLGFPRRFGIQFDKDFIKQYRITNEMVKWTFYHDPEFTKPYAGSDFTHSERVNPSNWVWGYFKGTPEEETSYVKMEMTSNDTVITTMYFKFQKAYRTINDIAYYIDPIIHEKVVHNGYLTEIVGPGDPTPNNSVFENEQINYHTQSVVTMNKPIIVARQVYWSERPKAVFMITPPHLQHYQKHILVIIKQLIDEIYAQSYVTKENRKPIVGLRMLFEEFGNIRSGDKGIPNIDTVTSIALGQDVQLTFVLQSYQQLRALYDDAIENIIRANSSNTIFLKSNDKELIEETTRLSGVRHEFRLKGKSSSRKVGDIVTVGEPVVNYSGEDAETTALTTNDLMFLAGRAPGNMIALPSNEMPIVNRMSTIMPMAAGLHKHLPQASVNEKGDSIPYSDGTMPTRVNDTVNLLENIIDGEALVRERVAQALLAQNIKEQYMRIARENNMVINEVNGELAELMMNTVYAEYDKGAGVVYQDVRKVDYVEMTMQMDQLLKTALNQKATHEEKVTAVKILKEHLIEAIMDPALEEYTALFKNATHSEGLLGWKAHAVSQFIKKMKEVYPEVVEDQMDIRDRIEEARGYGMEFDDPSELQVPFSFVDYSQVQAFEEIMVNIAFKDIEAPDGVTMSQHDTTIKIVCDNVHMVNIEVSDFKRQTYTMEYAAKTPAITKAVIDNKALLRLIQEAVKNY